MEMESITIVNTSIRQDQDGRFCLNDLHRAAVAQGKATKHHRPGEFMRRDDTKRLVTAIKKRCANTRITPVAIIKGNTPGVTQGTFVAKALVYAYAMWIDADFHLDVIEAFDRGQHDQRNLWQQMQSLIAKEVRSQVRASFGSRLMLDRKRELPSLRDERALLESAIQPSLLN
jgi:hypothetical protein